MPFFQLTEYIRTSDLAQLEQQLANLTPQEHVILQSRANTILSDAISVGNMDVLNCLLKVSGIRAQLQCTHFKTAVEMKHIQIACRLLEFEKIRELRPDIALNHTYDTEQEILFTLPRFFSYAERHIREFGPQVGNFIELSITQLRSTVPPYPASQEEAQLCYYMLRHIARVHSTLDDGFSYLLQTIRQIIAGEETEPHEGTPQFYFRFLLNLPAVRELVIHNATHRPESPNQQQNEIAKLGKNCFWLMEELNNIPEVRAQIAAEENSAQDEFYENSENSMIQLTPAEQAQLQSLTKHYQPQLIARGGVDVVFNQLLNSLAKRYQEQPALLTHKHKKPTPLPLHYQEFEALNVSNVQHRHANKAYYQHPTHTAWRYLNHKINNPWSRYTNRSVEYFKSHIVLFWLAATDPTLPIIDGCTPEHRFELWIQEIALIARAHNWDKTRPTKNDPRKTEYYHHLGPDEPSCLDGTLRRLFQSAKFHPLFIDLNATLHAALRDQILEHFKSHMSRTNTTDLETIFTNYHRYLLTLDQESAGPALLQATATWRITADFIHQWARTLADQYQPYAPPAINIMEILNTLIEPYLKYAASSECPLISFDVFDGQLGQLTEQQIKARSDGLYSWLQDSTKVLTLTEQQLILALHLNMLDKLLLKINADQMALLFGHESLQELLEIHAAPLQHNAFIDALSDEQKKLFTKRALPALPSATPSATAESCPTYSALPSEQARWQAAEKALDKADLAKRLKHIPGIQAKIDEIEQEHLQDTEKLLPSKSDMLLKSYLAVSLFEEQIKPMLKEYPLEIQRLEAFLAETYDYLDTVKEWTPSAINPMEINPQIVLATMHRLAKKHLQQPSFLKKCLDILLMIFFPIGLIAFWINHQLTGNATFGFFTRKEQDLFTQNTVQCGLGFG